MKKITHERYIRYYDINHDRFYWLDNITQQTTWNVTKWLQKQEIPMPLEDKMLHESQLKN